MRASRGEISCDTVYTQVFGNRIEIPQQPDLCLDLEATLQTLNNQNCQTPPPNQHTNAQQQQNQQNQQKQQNNKTHQIQTQAREKRFKKNLFSKMLLLKRMM